MTGKQRKRLTLALILLTALILGCIPVKLAYKDGGTVKYQALLWSYTRYHQLMGTGEAYYEGTEFRIFPFNLSAPVSHSGE